MTHLPLIPDETFQIYPGISHTRDTTVKFLQDIDICGQNDLTIAIALAVQFPCGIGWSREFASSL
jgi:hypothetical protein